MQACIFCQKLLPKHLYHQHIVDCSASNNDDGDLLDELLDDNGADYNHSTGAVQPKSKSRLLPLVSTRTTSTTPSQSTSTAHFPRLSTINTASHWLDSKSLSKQPPHALSESLSTPNLTQFRDNQQQQLQQQQQQHIQASPFQQLSSQHRPLPKPLIHPTQAIKSSKLSKPTPRRSSKIVAVDSTSLSTHELSQAAVRSREIDGLLSTSSDDSDYKVHFSIQPPQKRKFRHFPVDGADYRYGYDFSDDEDDSDDDCREKQRASMSVLSDVVSRQASTLSRLLSTSKSTLIQPGKIETISLVDSDVEDDATKANNHDPTNNTINTHQNHPTHTTNPNNNNTRHHRAQNRHADTPGGNDYDYDDDDDLFDPPVAKTTSKTTSKLSSKSTDLSSTRQPTKRQRLNNISLVSDNSGDGALDLPIPMGPQKKNAAKTASQPKGDAVSKKCVTNYNES